MPGCHQNGLIGALRVLVTAQTHWEIQAQILKHNVPWRIRMVVTRILKCLPVTEGKGSQYKGDFCRLRNRRFLNFTGLRADMGNDLVVAGHDYVPRTDAVKHPFADINNVNKLTVRCITCLHDGTVEPDADGIFCPVQLRIVCLRGHQIFHRLTRNSPRNQMAHQRSGHTGIAVREFINVGLLHTVVGPHAHLVSARKPIQSRFPRRDGLPTCTHHGQPGILKHLPHRFGLRRIFLQPLEVARSAQNRLALLQRFTVHVVDTANQQPRKRWLVVLWNWHLIHNRYQALLPTAP